MTSLALSLSPWRRWWRIARHRISRRPGAIAKPWNGIVIVGSLIAADQLAKHILVTETGFGHVSSTAWLIQAIAIFTVLPVLALIQLIRVPVLLVMAGAGGNALSDLLHGQVANPIRVQQGQNIVAFNLADIYMVSAAVMVIVLIATYRPRRPA